MKNKLLMITLILHMALPTLAGDELDKIRYELESNITASTGKHTPFWLMSNRHGLSSLENNNGYLSAGLYRNFDARRGLAWAYGAEIAGTWNHSAPFYIQQLYADIKYNCWELSIGSKERWAEEKHRTLSGGGLTFAPNARPIPQVRFGINEYTSAPWLFNEWIQVKGHFSYGKYTDSKFLKDHVANAPSNTWYTKDILFHEKTAFLKIGNEAKSRFSIEIGLEMYTQFGGKFMITRSGMSDSLRHDMPHGYKEYLKAFIPMAGGNNAPTMEQKNINGNFFGSWHFAANYHYSDWRVKIYYEHFYEDHSGLLGYYKCYHKIADQVKLVSYIPWYDGLYGCEINFPGNHFISSLVYEYINSRDQGGPILNDWLDPIVGKDNYYNNSLYQSWQHWGMAVCNPHHLSPVYVEPATLKMPYTRIRSHHIGFEGFPTAQLGYRFIGSWSRHWGSYDDPLPEPQNQLSLMAELNYIPQQWSGWQFTGAFALDRSQLIGNNTGVMLTIRKQGFIKDK